MKLILTIILISVIAIIGAEFTFIRRRIPLGTRHILLTGTEFIFIGFLLGPTFLNVLDQMTISSLHPLLSFGLGWIGFLFGLQFDFSKIKNLPHNYFSITLLQAIVTVSFIFITFFLIFKNLFNQSGKEAFIYALTLASAGACTGQASMAIVHRDYKIPSRGVMNLYRYIAGVDALVSIFIFGLVLCYSQANTDYTTSLNHPEALMWFGLSIILGLTMGIIFHLLTYVRLKQDELLLIIIGVVTFSAGVALYLRLSPLLINFFMGLFIANSTHRNVRIFEIMIRAEKSIYILLVLLAGAQWHPMSLWSALLVAVFIISRGLGKLSGGYLGAKLFPTGFNVPSHFGLGLLSQGGIAIAIIINFQQIQQQFPVNTILTIIIFGALINELISPSFVLKIVRKK
ncbi:hypothetical protein GF337_17470 [candidate division KSB1 bacterium]|nr:hypothetical protein [candidate division KSB1 bacterium]